MGVSVLVEEPLSQTPKNAPSGFVGSKRCAECHQEQFDEWEGSTHGKAGGPATEENVIGDFSGTPMVFKDALVRPFKDEKGAYFFELKLPDHDPNEYKVDYVVGGGFMEGGGGQSYFSRFQDGTVRLLPFEWSNRDGPWFVQTEADNWLPVSEKVSIFDISTWPPQRVLGSSLMFDQNCENCHGSQIELSYNPAQKKFKTDFTSLSINCESCHGPGQDHVQRVSANYDPEDPEIGMKSLATLSKEDSVKLCLQCHGVKHKLREDTYLPGMDFDEHFSMKIHTGFSKEFHPDGHIKKFQYQKNHLYSDCYINGSMTCVDCHDPHSLHYRDINGIKLIGKHDNRQCTSCHVAKSYDIEAHTHHRPQSEGSRCTSCHMPFLRHPAVGQHLNFFRSDHTISIPRPKHDASIGMENACFQCHRDKTTDQLDAQIKNWYGTLKPLKPIIKGMILSQESGGKRGSGNLLLQPGFPIAEVDAFSQYLVSHFNPLVRQSEKDLKKIRKYADSSDLDVSALGIAALQLASMHDPNLGEEVKSLMVKAGKDTSAIDRRRTVALSKLGEAWLEKRKGEHALVAFSASHDLDEESPTALIGLAKAMLAIGKKDEAPHLLLKAAEFHPHNSSIQNDIGVFLAMGGNLLEAENHIKRAIAIRGDNSAYHYNLGVALNSSGKSEAALETFSEAVRLDPGNTKAHLSLGKLYDRLGRSEDATVSFEKAYKSRSEDVYNLMNLAVIQLKRNRKKSSLSLMKKAVRLSAIEYGEKDSRTIDIMNRIKWLESQLP